jgi:hypothetical protein
MTIQKEKTVRRLSIDLRGDSAETFEEFRSRLSEELGFEVPASKAVLFAIKKLDNTQKLEQSTQ